MPRTLYRVWVDETGDRGTNPRSSPYFGFAAVVIRADRMGQVKEACVEINRRLNRADDVEIHWSKNLKDHEKRAVAAEVIAGLPVRIIYSVIEKATTPTGAHLADRDALYNYPLRLLLERVSWLVDRADEPNGGLADITLAAVEGLPKSIPLDYIELLRDMGGATQIRWQAIRRWINIEQAHRRAGLQAADVAAGALDRAMRPHQNPPHRIEPAYLRDLRHLIYTPGPGRMASYGLKALPGSLWTQFPWWPELNALPANG